MGFLSDRRLGSELRKALSEEQRASIENPSTPLTADGLIAVLGGFQTSLSGVAISETNAMTVAAVYRAVSLIASTIAGLPLHVYTLDAGSDRLLGEYPLLTDPWSEPYPSMTRFEWIELVMSSILLWGNSYVLKIRDGLGNVQRLLPLQPWSVNATRLIDPTLGMYGEKVFQVNGADGQPLLPNTNRLSTYEIMHTSGVGYDGIRGLSPIAHARESLGLAIAAEQHASRLFGSGSLMSGILQSNRDIKPEQADQIKAGWRNSISGLAKAHEVAVIGSGLTYIPIQVNPLDAQLLQSRQFSVTEVARWFGIPPHLLSDVDSSTSWGSGIAEQTLAWVKYGLGSYIRRLESRLTQDLLPNGQYFRFDMREFLRGDDAARMEFYAGAIGNGWMTRAEVRSQEDLTPGPASLAEFVIPTAVNPAPVPVGIGATKPSGKDPKGM